MGYESELQVPSIHPSVDSDCARPRKFGTRSTHVHPGGLIGRCSLINYGNEEPVGTTGLTGEVILMVSTATRSGN